MHIYLTHVGSYIYPGIGAFVQVASGAVLHLQFSENFLYELGFCIPRVAQVCVLAGCVFYIRVCDCQRACEPRKVRPGSMDALLEAIAISASDAMDPPKWAPWGNLPTSCNLLASAANIIL